MSGRGGRDASRWEPTRGEGSRAQMPLLDRLIDEAPDVERDPAHSAGEMIALLRRSVQRDLEALLNARRRWRSWPRHLGELGSSPLGFGIPDFASGAYNERSNREELRAEIEATIRRYEPRFVHVRVTLIENADQQLESTLRLRIDALLHADPAPEPVAYDTTVEAATSEVRVRARDGGEGIARDV